MYSETKSIMTVYGPSGNLSLKEIIKKRNLQYIEASPNESHTEKLKREANNRLCVAEREIETISDNLENKYAKLIKDLVFDMFDGYFRKEHQLFLDYSWDNDLKISQMELSASTPQIVHNPLPTKITTEKSSNTKKYKTDSNHKKQDEQLIKNWENELFQHLEHLVDSIQKLIQTIRYCFIGETPGLIPGKDKGKEKYNYLRNREYILRETGDQPSFELLIRMQDNYDFLIDIATDCAKFIQKYKGITINFDHLSELQSIYGDLSAILKELTDDLVQIHESKDGYDNYKDAVKQIFANINHLNQMLSGR